MIIPLAYFGGVGIVRAITYLKKSYVGVSLLTFFAGFIVLESVFAFSMYYWHYPAQAHVIRSWQCGYKELFTTYGEELKMKEHVHMTSRHGQPYIYYLWYLKYDPATYQKNASYTGADEYGFSQVKSFDKYVFSLPASKNDPESLYIGYPDEMSDNLSQSKEIKLGTESIFEVYDPVTSNTLREN
ncbi:MAG: hypothetical protein UZ21_OP11001000160 [Microgenomates bacterium OLB22]|nr:MAG: hypothetical protein UZ21_OP11001000160 [Microgenomates bacterium OLB22]